MTRSVALRASALFILFSALFATIGVGSHTVVAEALFLVSGSLCALMLFFALATRTHAPAPIPVRVRRRR